MIKAILYDMDGTVLDTMKIYQHCWDVADAAMGYGGRVASLIPKIAGMSSADSGLYVKTVMGEDFPYTEFRRIVDRTLTETIERDGLDCKKGAPEIFDRIRALGIQQILVTSSSPDRVFPYLEIAGLHNAFDQVITGDMVVHSKPDPEIFLLGARAANALPEECLVVEDAPNGIRAGVAAGMRTVMIPEYPPISEEIRAILWKECADLSELFVLVKE